MLKTDSRSIWNKARRRTRQLTAADFPLIAEMVALVTEEIYTEIDRVDRDIRNDIQDVVDDSLANDVSALESRVTDLEAL